MALTDDWSLIEASAHNESPKQLRARLEALDWSALDLHTDLAPLRRALQRLEQRFGVRPTHRWASNRVLAKATSVTAEHGFVHGDGAITGVALSPDGKRLVTCNEYDTESSSTEAGTMALWDVLAGRVVQHSEECLWGLGQRYGSGPGQLQWSADGTYVYALQPSASGVLWSMRPGDFLGQNEMLADSGIGSTVHASWTPDGQLAYQLGPIRERPFELLSPTVEAPVMIAALKALGGGAGATEGDELGIGGWFIRAHFSASLARAVCVSSEGSIYIVDTESGRVIEWHSPRKESVEELSPEAPLFARLRDGAITHRDGGAWKDNSDDADAPLSPDGRAYVCVREGALCAVDLETQRVLVVLSKRPDRVHGVRWDRAGERVAIAHKRAIEVFNVRAATRAARIEIDTRPPRPEGMDRRVFDGSVCAFSRGATLFAAVDKRGVVHCYDADFREIATAKAARRAFAVEWASDDAVLVVWGEGLIEFWDTRALWSGGALRRIAKHEHLSPSEEKPGRHWVAGSRPYGPNYESEWKGPAAREPNAESFAGEGLRALVELGMGRPGSRFAFFGVAGEEAFAMFSLYRVRNRGSFVLVCRPEHERRALGSTALVVDDLHGWPYAWAVGTTWAKVAHTWEQSLAIGAPDVLNWRERLLEA